MIQKSRSMNKTIFRLYPAGTVCLSETEMSHTFDNYYIQKYVLNIRNIEGTYQFSQQGLFVSKLQYFVALQSVFSDGHVPL